MRMRFIDKFIIVGMLGIGVYSTVVLIKTFIEFNS